MAESPRVMIISAKVGAGHMRAAEALEEAFRDHYPGAQVKNTEVLEHANAAFRRTFTSKSGCRKHWCVYPCANHTGRSL